MQYEIRQRPNFSIAHVQFDRPGEELKVESAAMVAKDTAIDMETNMEGGLLASAKRKMLGGESLFQNTFTSQAAGETMWVAPPAEGDIIDFEMDGREAIYMSSGNFIASGTGVDLDSEFTGGKGFFSGTSMFMLKATGKGPLFLGSYGAVHEVDVGREGYIVDNNHIVGFTEGLDYNVRKVGGLVSLAGGGEGIVCEFQGQGKLWLSTRSSDALARFLHPFRRVQSSND
jgi:uncharacterized protein (TIGR00266 family)